MLVPEDEAAVVQPDSLPDAVTQHKPGVEDGHHSLIALDEGPVDRNENVPIARIVVEFVRARCHWPLLALTARG